MKKMFCLFLLLLMIGCGNSNNGNGVVVSEYEASDDNSSSMNTTTSKKIEFQKTDGQALLGNLSGAKVNIYEIEENGSKQLKWTETTSNGEKLDEIGYFEAHKNELNQDRFYLYEIVGGRDWDSDDDGVKDSEFTKNSGTIRAVIKGSYIKDSNITVNMFSELIYQQVKKYIDDFNATKLEISLNDNVKNILRQI